MSAISGAKSGAKKPEEKEDKPAAAAAADDDDDKKQADGQDGEKKKKKKKKKQKTGPTDADAQYRAACEAAAEAAEKDGKDAATVMRLFHGYPTDYPPLSDSGSWATESTMTELPFDSTESSFSVPTWSDDGTDTDLEDEEGEEGEEREEKEELDEDLTEDSDEDEEEEEDDDTSCTDFWDTSELCSDSWKEEYWHGESEESDFDPDDLKYMTESVVFGTSDESSTFADIPDELEDELDEARNSTWRSDKGNTNGYHPGQLLRMIFPCDTDPKPGNEIGDRHLMMGENSWEPFYKLEYFGHITNKTEEDFYEEHLKDLICIEKAERPWSYVRCDQFHQDFLKPSRLHYWKRRQLGWVLGTREARAKKKGHSGLKRAAAYHARRYARELAEQTRETPEEREARRAKELAELLKEAEDFKAAEAEADGPEKSQKEESKRAESGKDRSRLSSVGQSPGGGAQPPRKKQSSMQPPPPSAVRKISSNMPSRNSVLEPKKTTSAAVSKASAMKAPSKKKKVNKREQKRKRKDARKAKRKAKKTSKKSKNEEEEIPLFTEEPDESEKDDEKDDDKDDGKDDGKDAKPIRVRTGRHFHGRKVKPAKFLRGKKRVKRLHLKGRRLPKELGRELRHDKYRELDIVFQRMRIRYQTVLPVLENRVRCYLVYGDEDTRGEKPCVEPQEEAYCTREELAAAIETFDDWCPEDVEEEMENMPIESDSSDSIDDWWDSDSEAQWGPSELSESSTDSIENEPCRYPALPVKLEPYQESRSTWSDLSLTPACSGAEDDARCRIGVDWMDDVKLRRRQPKRRKRIPHGADSVPPPTNAELEKQQQQQKETDGDVNDKGRKKAGGSAPPLKQQEAM